MAAGEEIVAGVMSRPLLSCVRAKQSATTADQRDNAGSKGRGRGGGAAGLTAGGTNGGGKESTVRNACK